jgi:hypothetical protein
MMRLGPIAASLRAPAPPVGLTFDPANKCAGVSLSPDKLTVTYTGSGGDYAGVFGTLGASSGKYYSEYTVNTLGGTNFSTVGIFLSTDNPCSEPGNGSSHLSHGYGYEGRGYIFHSGAFTFVGVAYGIGDVIGVAVDLNAGSIWFSKNGTWLSGDPALGTSPSASIAPGRYCPGAGMFNPTDSITVNFGATAYASTPPLYFGNWDHAVDPLFSSVLAFAQFNGADGSTFFPDVVAGPWSALAGSPEITAAHSIYGGSSLNLDGTCSVQNSIAGLASIGTGDITVEMWAHLTTIAAGSYFFDMITGNQLVIQVGGDSGINFGYYDASTGISGPLYEGGPVATTGADFHIAVSRQSGIMRAFVNGVMWGSGASSKSFTDPVAVVGQFGPGGHHQFAYINQVRITAAARYTANFTPQLGFPTS